ncbi:RNA polymerase sigma factor [Nannocystis bainbridge]|uniref:Sigma-70 family RNA polymerase sigma factor n=1 Tax=Nannocystis bainbridge TaxID=2995303 RepID=A0ABT5EF28_9BACT|nr:sigma-70 family RNA polymerase sigma factor [Nannocystis bainbridge]MDC0723422.1 sigma-70 family RNA polymerase sigma factor [Nannocystis bainbridge]
MTSPPSPPDEPSDADLLEAWRAGDAAAGELLFARHYRLLKRYFRNKVRAEHIADLMQETFVASVESRERVTDASRFRGYLLRIAYHVFCRHLRRRPREAPEADLDAVSVEQLDPGAVSVIARTQEQRLLLEGLRAIPVNYQVVLELHYWEDMRTDRIAEVLGVPPATVRSRLQRARDALQAAMDRLARSREVLESTLTRLEDWAARCGRELGGASDEP